jgi:hypothetical protein
MAAETIIVQAPCNDCGRITDHEVLKIHRKTIRENDDDPEWYTTTYRMIECRGCHFICLERTNTSFEDQQGDPPKREYFPPPISRRKPDWLGDFVMNVPVSLDLPDLLDEVYSALHANNRRLAAMGARTLLDVAIVDSVGDIGGFGAKVQALESKGIIGKQQREYLEVALDAGSAAAHRGHCPTAQQLNNVMDIVESILHQIYVLPQAAAELKKSTPLRKKSVK